MVDLYKILVGTGRGLKELTPNGFQSAYRDYSRTFGFIYFKFAYNDKEGIYGKYYFAQKTIEELNQRKNTSNTKRKESDSYFEGTMDLLHQSKEKTTRP